MPARTLSLSKLSKAFFVFLLLIRAHRPTSRQVTTMMIATATTHRTIRPTAPTSQRHISTAK